eukprot:9502364-Pyramimonas_sp.AAC.1
MQRGGRRRAHLVLTRCAARRAASHQRRLGRGDVRRARRPYRRLPRRPSIPAARGRLDGQQPANQPGDVEVERRLRLQGHRGATWRGVGATWTDQEAVRERRVGQNRSRERFEALRCRSSRAPCDKANPIGNPSARFA